jgi:outer membrane protein assembly factor BamB
MHMPPIIYENILVMSDTGTVVKAFSLSSKKAIWQDVCPSPFLLGFNDKAVCATDSGLVAFDIKTGKKSWTVPGRHEWYMYPCVFENKFYYYSRKEDKLLVITPEGKVFTEFYLKGKTYTAARVTADKIILGISDKIFAIENK